MVVEVMGPAHADPVAPQPQQRGKLLHDGDYLWRGSPRVSMFADAAAAMPGCSHPTGEDR
jgi:hypothetical protein